MIVIGRLSRWPRAYTTMAMAKKGIAAVMESTAYIDAWGTKIVDATKARGR